MELFLLFDDPATNNAFLKFESSTESIYLNPSIPSSALVSNYKNQKGLPKTLGNLFI